MRWLWCVWLALVSLAHAGDGKVDVHLMPWAERSLATYKGHEQETLRERDARFAGMKTRFGVRYKSGYREDRPGEAFPLEGYIGMPQPRPCNWYHSGFMKVTVNGQDVGRTALASMVVAEAGERAIVDMVWHTPMGAVRVRFLGLPDDDRLFCEVRVDPKGEECRLQLNLRSYPSFFTSHHRRKGARRVLTPTTEVKEGEKRQLTVATDDWAFHHDLVFDPALGEGAGGCAVLVGPEKGAEIRHEPGGYAAHTFVDFAADTRVARLVFWDFAGQENAVALEQMRARIPGTREQLAGLDFTPTAVRQADFAALRETVAADLDAAARVPGTEELVAQARTWLASLPPGSARADAENGIVGEEVLARWLGEYHTFRWRLRLAVVLSKI